LQPCLTFAIGESGKGVNCCYAFCPAKVGELICCENSIVHGSIFGE